MNENPRIIAPMSTRLREAFAKEMAKEEYKGLDEILAAIQAAEVLLQRHQESHDPIFSLFPLSFFRVVSSRTISLA